MRNAPALCLAATLAGFAPVPAAAEISAERVERLEHMLVQDCGSCHGLVRKGGLGSPLTRDALAHAAPEGLAAIILDGIPGTAMPPWRALLTEAEALWMAHHLLMEPRE
ncbi:c-type cytochrome [Roseovarius autotrophicus]|uniref:c-type cytochrome n=1 Tax=Roseovarius autotrophicus TaxID=2824121 RepID=UPI001B384CFF|nr:cytochrome c [Roseovarius autotrophicus]